MAVATGIAILAGAVLNATAFTGSTYLARYLAGDSSAAHLAGRRRGSNIKTG